MRVPTRMITSLLALSLLWFLGSCSSSDRGDTVRIGYHRLSGNLPIFVADKLGYFESAGLQIELRTMENTSDIVNSIVKGDLHVGGLCGFSYLFITEGKFPGKVKLFLPIVEDEENYANSIIVRADSDIESLADLSGKKVGTYSGPSQRIYLELFLRVSGLGDLVDVIQVGKAYQLQALVSGEFDALFTTEPFVTQAVTGGSAKVLYANARRDILDPFPVGSFVIAGEFLEKRPEAAGAALEAIDKGLQYMTEHPREARELLVEYLNLDEEVAQNVSFYTYVRDPEQDLQSYDELMKILVESEIVSDPVIVDDMFMHR